jgi:hypothetical protein
MNLVLNLLWTSLEKDDVDFWANIMQQHAIDVTVTSVNEFRAGFIRHVFFGNCVAQHSIGCKAVVSGERWEQSMAIHVIDSTLNWVKEGMIDVKEFGNICRALDITSTTKDKVRSWTAKLNDLQRRHLGAMDAASLSLAGILPNLGNSSSVKLVDSIADVHGVQVSAAGTKEGTSSRVLNHIIEGKCAEGTTHSPGCKQIAGDTVMSYEDSVHLQVAILRCIISIGSKKQLSKILDLQDIYYEETDKVKKLRLRLKKFVEEIERGKMKEVEAEYERLKNLRILNNVRKNWPNLLPSKVKEAIVNAFRSATSSAALAFFTCACCSREMSVTEKVRKQHTDLDLSLLDIPDKHWNDDTFAVPPSPFETGPLQGKLLDTHGVYPEGNGFMLELCTTCSRSLWKGSLPKHALANRLYVGPMPEELSDLTMVEESMIARARAKSWIMKLQEGDSESAPPIPNVR